MMTQKLLGICNKKICKCRCLSLIEPDVAQRLDRAQIRLNARALKSDINPKLLNPWQYCNEGVALLIDQWVMVDCHGLSLFLFQ